MPTPVQLSGPPRVAHRPSASGPVGPPGQRSFDELEDPLREVTFVVVDLETTGGSAATECITEIGAVKVRGGCVLGEFATLVDPGRNIPPQIVLLTGITDAMVVAAPRIQAVLPAFLEFIRGSVLVAHNAAFDIGFLKAACRGMSLAWPGNAVVDTLWLARRVLSRQEAPSVRLSRLAELFHAATRPDHRALHDARATVDVLHALFERLGPLGVHSLTELRQLGRDVGEPVRRRRQLADRLPEAPGVYLFRGPRGEVLYVGTSGNLRRRVRNYFGNGEVRPRIRQMVTQAESIDHVECAHALEAQVREQRLIAAHQPRYNRRSRAPGRVWWVVLTQEPFPRLSVVSRIPAEPTGCLGPFFSRVGAQDGVDALQEVVAVRRCTPRLSRAPTGTPCVLAELGRCGAPCAGRESRIDYAGHVERITGLIAGRSDEVLSGLRSELHRLAGLGHFDRAAVLRDRLAGLARVVERRQRIGAFTDLAELVAARPDGAGGWELSVVRHGRLAAAGRARRGVDPRPVIDLLRASAETVVPGRAPLPAGSAEEAATLLRWIEQPRTRLAAASDGWFSPARGAGRWRPFMAAAGLAELAGAALERSQW